MQCVVSERKYLFLRADAVSESPASSELYMPVSPCKLPTSTRTAALSFPLSRTSACSPKSPLLAPLSRTSACSPSTSAYIPFANIRWPEHALDTHMPHLELPPQSIPFANVRWPEHALDTHMPDVDLPLQSIFQTPNKTAPVLLVSSPTVFETPECAAPQTTPPRLIRKIVAYKQATSPTSPGDNEPTQTVTSEFVFSEELLAYVHAMWFWRFRLQGTENEADFANLVGEMIDAVSEISVDSVKNSKESLCGAHMEVQAICRAMCAKLQRVGVTSRVWIKWGEDFSKGVREFVAELDEAIMCDE
jgi:hypothetical protein